MDVQTIDSTTATTAATAVASADGATPSGALQPGTTTPGTSRPVPVENETLHKALSSLAGQGAKVSVSFRVLHHPNEIVTVFRNAETGEEIVQFPPEAMILIAEFFDKLAGAVLDRSV
jgi:uncharacterized FlaG/YvyC family protein